ncbi:MAG: ABC transporter ATP-binding protein [Candidatus Kapaibacterium sp.]
MLQGRAAEPFTTAIEVEHLDFSYTPDRQVLRDISFTVRKGEMVALVGATGSGKSTIINLLCGFYDYEHGSIRIDGTELRTIDRKSHRSRIALVLQDVFLFSRSVRENILMGRTGIDDEHMKSVARSIGAEFIDALPQGYDTQVMERGSTLSTGQKQLLSFARAIVSEPEIIILDEATASIDTETEQLIDRAMERSLKGRTSIVIAHRLSTIQRAERIIVLHHGSIAEQGTHDELLRHKGLYSKLHRLQYAQPQLSVTPATA